MHNLKRRIVCLAMTGTLAIAGLAGCAGQAGQVAQTKEPSSASELAELCEKSSGAKNHHFEGDIEISLNVVGQALPMKASVGGDVVDDNAHFTMTMELMGEKQQNETYIVKEGNSYVQYSSSKTESSASKTDGNAQQWSKSTSSSNPIGSLSSKSLLSEGEFSKDGDAYTITLTGEQVMNALIGNDKDLEKDINDATTTELRDALKNGKLVFAFDKDGNPTSENANFEYAVKSEMLGQQVDMNIKVAANVKLSNQGKVDASKVAVPENVKSNAVDASADLNDLLKQLESLGTVTAQPAA